MSKQIAMSLITSLIGEIKHESALTRKILERVPLDKKDWRPHEKSMTLGRLATHIAENLRWASEILSANEFDFAVKGFTAHTAGSSEELLSIHDRHLQAALELLAKHQDEDLSAPWTIRRGEAVFGTMPKKVAIRGYALNHVIHHRGQLSVYLRLLDVPVPGLYGPSADDKAAG